jgi:hypothetical protein
MKNKMGGLTTYWGGWPPIEETPWGTKPIALTTLDLWPTPKLLWGGRNHPASHRGWQQPPSLLIGVVVATPCRFSGWLVTYFISCFFL